MVKLIIIILNGNEQYQWAENKSKKNNRIQLPIHYYYCLFFVEMLFLEFCSKQNLLFDNITLSANVEILQLWLKTNTQNFIYLLLVFNHIYYSCLLFLSDDSKLFQSTFWMRWRRWASFCNSSSLSAGAVCFIRASHTRKNEIKISYWLI